MQLYRGGVWHLHPGHAGSREEGRGDPKPARNLAGTTTDLSDGTKQAFKTSRKGQRRELVGCSGSKAATYLERKEQPAPMGESQHVIWLEAVLGPLWATSSILRVGTIPSISLLAHRQGPSPLSASPTSDCWMFGSQMLRRCGCTCILCLELASELRAVTSCQNTERTTGAEVHADQQAFGFGA